MIRLTIMPAAYTATLATHPASTGLKQNRAPNGDFYVWFEPQYVRQLHGTRKLGETFREVILRLAEASEGADVRLADDPSIARPLVAKKRQANHTPSLDVMLYGARLAVRAKLHAFRGSVDCGC